MKLSQRIKNAVAAFKTETNLGDEDILEFLGIKNTNKKVLSEITYFTCLKMLSETMGKIPIKYYQETEKGKIRAKPTETYRLLSERPNRNMTASTFWTTVELNTQHYGNGYVWIRKEFKWLKYGGETNIKDFWIMPSNDVQILMDNTGVFGEKGKLYYQYSDKHSGENYVFSQDDVMHFKTGFSFDGITGEPVRKILEHTIEGSLESQTFMNNLYKQGLTASMAIQYVGEIEEKNVKKLQKKYEKYLTGSQNAGKIVPVPVGLQLTPLKMNLTDAQFFELRKHNALQIAGAFGIKPNQINNYEKSSYNSSETQQLAFLVDTMAFRLKHYEEEINYKTLTPEEKAKQNYYNYNEKAILRTDSKSQKEILTGYVNNAIYTPNEARELLGLPYEEGGDILMANGNYIPLTKVGAQYLKGGENNEQET